MFYKASNSLIEKNYLLKKNKINLTLDFKQVIAFDWLHIINII
jgi:hypothetical protein